MEQLMRYASSMHESRSKEPRPPTYRGVIHILPIPHCFRLSKAHCVARASSAATSPAVAGNQTHRCLGVQTAVQSCLWSPPARACQHTSRVRRRLQAHGG
jgi:hypothetical protein